MAVKQSKRGSAVDDFDDDDDDDDSFHQLQTDEESGVQLGTVLPLDTEGSQADSVLFKNADWHEWDGGKAGGWPVWLNPRDLPAPQDMRCGECSHPLSFLVQLYCPLDHEDDAFHRCLYVFCCPKASCSKNSSVKALRCQLPRENAFYPYEPDDKAQAVVATVDAETAQASIAMLAKQQAGSDPGVWGVKVCCVCGQLAKSACSKCRSARYCGREHQSQHWKSGGHKKVCTANANADQAPGAKTGANITAAAGPLPVGSMTAPSASVFRQFEVQVRPEPPPPPVAPDGRTAEDTLIGKMGLGGGEDDDDDEGAAAVDGIDEDSELSQAELDKVAGVHGVKDKMTLQFLTRTQTNPQVVRYDAVDAGPLWSSSAGIPKGEDVPPCGRCGRTRKFEFQVMPHLLHHLGVDANAKALDAKTAAVSGRQGPGVGPPTPAITGECMDWGTLAVYTCPDSCPSNPPRRTAEPSASGGEGVEDDKGADAPVVGYVEEFVWRQPPP